MPARRPPPLAPLALLAACAGKGPDAPADDSAAPADPGCATCAIEDTHNY